MWIDTRTSADDLGHRFEVAVQEDDVSGDWVIQNEKIDVFQTSGISNIDASLLAGVKSMASKNGVDVNDANLSYNSDGQIYMVGDTGDIRNAIVNSIDGQADSMSAGSDFRADFYTQWLSLTVMEMRRQLMFVLNIQVVIVSGSL